VTAVEPGGRLIAQARKKLARAGEVRFVNARLEDAPLPRAHYRAVFSASAIHWVDPDVSWRKVADGLVAGGTLALISYFGLEDPRSGDDQQAVRAALAWVAPELAADWPIYRDLDDTLAGVEQRRDNVSEAWAWLGSYDVARAYAADLFEKTQLVAVPILVEHTADALNALLGTMAPIAPTARCSRRRDLRPPRAARAGDPLERGGLPGDGPAGTVERALARPLVRWDRFAVLSDLPRGASAARPSAKMW
jgi:hypothetical protein